MSVPLRRCLMLAIALSCAHALPAHAADTLLVHAGHVVDVETGKVLDNQYILLEKGRIASIGPTPNAASDTPQLDWSAYTVVPGLMDMHTHLADEGQSADPAAPLKSNPGRDAFIGAKNARDTLRAGFTT
ncbi:MAG: metal-dependent hydrolase family protein, partial [Pseudoxanthomonas sp.]